MERNRASRSSVMCDKHGSKCISFRWWPCWFRAFSLCVCVWVGGFLQLCGCLLRHNEERQHHETRTKSCQHLHKTQNEKEKKKVGMKEKGTWERTLRKKKEKRKWALVWGTGLCWRFALWCQRLLVVVFSALSFVSFQWQLSFFCFVAVCCCSLGCLCPVFEACG